MEVSIVLFIEITYHVRMYTKCAKKAIFLFFKLKDVTHRQGNLFLMPKEETKINLRSTDDCRLLTFKYTPWNNNDWQFYFPSLTMYLNKFVKLLV